LAPDDGDRNDLAHRIARSGVSADEADLDEVLPIFRENRDALERLRPALDLAEEPAPVFTPALPRADGS